MQALITKLTKYAGLSVVLFGAIMWVLDYLKIDITPIVEALGISPDLFGGIGFTGLLGFGSAWYVKSTQMKMQQSATTIANESIAFMLSVKDEFTSMQTLVREMIKEQSTTSGSQNVSNALLVETLKFQKLLAEKNLESELIDDKVKADLKLWIAQMSEKIKNIQNSNTFDIKQLGDEL